MGCKNMVLFFEQRINLTPDATTPGLSISDTITGIEFHTGSPYIFRLDDPECKFSWDGSAEYTTDLSGFRFTLTPVTSGFTISAQNLIHVEHGVGPAMKSVFIQVFQNGGLFLPRVTSTDNGKILMVIDGEWRVVDKSTEAPNSSNTASS